MKRLMMRCMLLFAAIGYFFAAVHTHEHSVQDLACHHQATHAQPTGADGPQAEDDHECPICLVQSLAIAVLPLFESDRTVVLFQHIVPDQALHALVTCSPTSTLGARAPPSA